MSFARPALSDLIQRISSDLNGRLPGADSRLRRALLSVIARAWAGACHEIYGFLARIALQILPDTADADGVGRWRAIFGLPPVPAVAAAGGADLVGTNGSIVPIGTLLQRGDGVEYQATAAATIALGVASLSVAAVDPGAAGNADAGVLLTFVSPVSGVNSQATVSAGGIVGGLDEGTAPVLLAGLLAHIQEPPAGGKEADYEKWAKDGLPGVTRVWVYPNNTGLGTVGVAFVMDGRPNIIPLPADVTTVQAAIDAERPVTAAVTAFGPTASALTYDITLTPNTADVQAAVTAALDDLHAREAEPGGTLLISHIRQAVSEAAGETDNVVNSPTANVVAAAGQIKTRGAVAFH